MRRLAIIFSAFVLLACAGISVPVETPKEANDRIVYRDLTRPKAVHYPVPVLPQTAPVKGNTEAHSDASIPNRFIEFANDSTTQFDEIAMAAFAEATPTGTPILVMGHSHGSSAVGVRSLATKRAETVQQWLQGRGFDSVYTMASWGGRTVWFAPNRGVHLYVLKQGEADLMTIAFGKQTEQEEKKHGSPEINDSIAARTSQTVLGGL